MPGGVSSQQAAVAPYAWQERSDDSVRRQPVLPPLLPGREVETAPACGPRNPVRRALGHIGELLSRTFASILPGCARLAAASAARDTRTQLARVLDQLASGDAPGTTLAADLHKLARTQRDWARLDPNADRAFGHAIEEQLDQRWPREQGLALMRALAGPAVADAQQHIQHCHDLEAERALMQLADAVTHTVADRAFDTIRHGFNEALAAVHVNELTSGIAEKVERAVVTGATLLGQLRGCGALEPAAPAGTSAGKREQLEAEQVAQILQSLLTEALERTPAAGAEQAQDLDRLLQHFSSQSLETLRRAGATGTAANTSAPAVNAALEREIADRPARLLSELSKLIEEGDAFKLAPGDGPSRERSSTIAYHTFGSELEKAQRLKQQILDHCQLFGLQSPGETLQTLLGTLSSSVGTLLVRGTGVRIDQLAKARSMAGSVLDEQTANQVIASWRLRIETLEATATQAAMAMLAALNTDGTATQLVACKEMLTAIHTHLKAQGLEGAAQSDVARRHGLHAALTALLGKEDARRAFDENGARMLAALRSPEMQAVITTLTKAEAQARGQEGLEATNSELVETLIALQILTVALEEHRASGERPVTEDDRAGTSARAAGEDTLQSDTLAELERLFGVLPQPGGEVRLTMGACAPAFARSMTEVIEMPFSQQEMSCVTVAGILVPTQFLIDAERGGTEYSMNDGQPLIDRSGWDVLRDQEKQERIARGYQRLVAFYDNNEQQTRAVVRLANQTITAALLAAQKLSTADSPMVLEGLGAGVLLAAPVENSSSMTVVSFSKGRNHLPRVQLSYEVRGGHVALEDGEQAGEAIYLDRERSRAKIAVLVEARPGEDHLCVVGTPTYDVHLVRNSIQRPYPVPVPEHLEEGAQVLYDDLINFAIAEQAPGARAALETMLAIVRAKRAFDPQEAYEGAKQVFDSYLGEDPRGGARDPAGVGADAARQIRELFESFDRKNREMVFLFDPAVAEIEAHVKYLLPDWTPPWIPGTAASVDAAHPGGPQAGDDPDRLPTTRLTDGVGRERDRPMAPSMAGRRNLDALCAALREQGEPGARIANYLTATQAFSLNEDRTVEDARQIVDTFFLKDPPLLTNNRGRKVLEQIQQRIHEVSRLREECSRQALEPLYHALRPAAVELLLEFRSHLLAEQQATVSAEPESAV